jgi:hypothetical protein
VAGNWNPTGREFCPVPNPEFAKFKLHQFYRNLRSACVVAMLLQSAFNFLFLDHSVEQIIKEDCLDMSVGLGIQVVFTIVISWSTRFIAKEQREAKEDKKE